MKINNNKNGIGMECLFISQKIGNERKMDNDKVTR